MQILDTHSAWRDSLANLWVMGEVKNNTGYTLRYVKITVNVFDAEGAFLDTDFGYVSLDNLAPGDKACFNVLFLDDPVGRSYYEFEYPTYRTDGEPVTGLTVIDQRGTRTQWWYEIVGRVRNDAGYRIEYVSPIATLYDAIGKVISCDYAYVNGTHLDPNQISSFKILASVLSNNAVASYRLQVDGNPE